MRFIRAKFLNLAGLYSKSGKTEVEIDFTKCKYDIIYITGPNGYGKSTLMSVLQPLPDSPNMYLNKKPGLKEIEYYNNGIRYLITIEYPVNSKYDRAQTKAYFKEMTAGVWEELNPNGNIGSYKDIIYSKFNLDSNFLALSQISIESRGIVDKRPSERKKYVSDILDYTEAYNDIHKAISKRSVIYKSMINNLTAKIDSIGDEQKIISDIQSIDMRLIQLTAEKNSVIEAIATEKANINILDPNGEIQERYTTLLSEKGNLDDKIKSTMTIIKSMGYESCSSLELAIADYNKYSEALVKLNADKDYLSDKISTHLKTKEEDAKTILIKTNKISSLSDECDFAGLVSRIDEYKSKILQYEETLKKIGYTSGVFDISKDEYILGLTTLSDIRGAVLKIKMYASEKALNKAYEYLTDLSTPSQGGFDEVSYNNIIAEKQTLEATLSEAKEQCKYYQGLSETLSILSKRPKKCKIDTCDFIKAAVEAKEQNPVENLNRLSIEISDIEYRIRIYEKEIDFANEVRKIYNDLLHILRNIDSHKNIIAKLPNGKAYIDPMKFLSRVMSGDTFNDIADIYIYIDYANVFDEYKRDKKILDDLEVRYKLVTNKIEVINEIQNELDALVDKTKDLDKDIEVLNEAIYNTSIEIINNEKLKETCDNLISKYKELARYQKEQEDYTQQLGVLKDSISKISESINKINSLNSRLIAIEHNLAPLSADKDKYKYALTQLAQYKSELAEFNDQYTKIELIREYTSPTKDGIQLVFVKLYMGKTLQIANQLLSYFFDGNIELLPYQIDNNEFRIPCINKMTSLINDDISSCSTGERFMISMVLSFAMKLQSSSVYNIISLDEVNGTLDAKNKAAFPIVLDKIKSILNIEQCLLVSQTMEQDFSNINADIISLAPIYNEQLKGNLIFQM